MIWSLTEKESYKDHHFKISQLPLGYENCLFILRVICASTSKHFFRDYCSVSTVVIGAASGKLRCIKFSQTGSFGSR